jgi:hypothetical protein
MNLRCPAGEAEHGVQSIHAEDVRCRLSGLLQGVDDAPCVSDAYLRCPVWTAEKQRLWASKRAARSPQMLRADGESWVAA